MSLKNRKESGMDNEFTGPFPRYSGAISAVTNGSPEDINEMPASNNSSERISPCEPTDADVKSGYIDDTVMPG